MRYRRHKLDANQREIADGLARLGCTVVDLSAVGGGCPDLLVGYRGRTYLIEIKAPDAAKRRWNTSTHAATLERQQKWRDNWSGRAVAVVTTLVQAAIAVGLEVVVDA